MDVKIELDEPDTCTSMEPYTSRSHATHPRAMVLLTKYKLSKKMLLDVPCSNEQVAIPILLNYKYLRMGQLLTEG